MQNLTRENQSYRDRLQRAKSWLKKTQTIEEIQEGDVDCNALFVFLWIALSALYSREKSDSLSDHKDFTDFLVRLYKLDHQCKLRTTLMAAKAKADVLLRDKFLCDLNWKERTSPRVLELLAKDNHRAQVAWTNGDLVLYLQLLFRRLRLLRNQIFHGCSTDRRSLNRNSLMPAVGILQALIPALVLIFEQCGQREGWPSVAYPRAGSPLNPDCRVLD